jgi:hypothetical protein
MELRISDLDRDRAAAVLHAAVGDGRLTWAEHEERLAGVYQARTGSELAPWLADLSAAEFAPGELSTMSFQQPAVGEAPVLQVAFSKVARRVDPSTRIQRVDVTLGAVILDLRNLPDGSLLDVVASSTLGKVEVYISPGTSLIDEGTAWLGKRSTVERRKARGVRVRPGAPVVRITGHSVLGHVRVTIG